MTSSETMTLGLLLGLRHASDADHLSALATLVRGERGVSSALRTATWWSLGHSVTLLVTGLVVVALGLELPPSLDRAAQAFVAVLLVGLGLRRALQRRDDEAPSPPGRSLLVGLAHGLAGSTGLALLALATFSSRSEALAYLGLYGVGTVLGMLSLTAALWGPLCRVAARSTAWAVWLGRAAGAVSVLMGVALGVGLLRGDA